MIIFDHVTALQGKKAVLNDVTFAIRPSEFVCLTGPSGAGKTTLLNLLIGAVQPKAGQVTIDGVALNRVPRKALQLYRRRLGIIFQEAQLFWQKTVRENIGFQLEILAAAPQVVRGRTDELMASLDLTKVADVLCADLSSGERARVALARAIAHKPMIIVADEPTAMVDTQAAAAVLQQLRLMHAERATVILVTNDARLAASLGVRIITFENGKLIADTEPAPLPEAAVPAPAPEPAPVQEAVAPGPEQVTIAAA